MESLINKMRDALNHIKSLDDTFSDDQNYTTNEDVDVEAFYSKHKTKFEQLVGDLEIEKELYGEEGRQMILADLIEYIFLGRGYYAISNTDSKEDKEKFIKCILHFVNMLICYEALTVDDNLRDNFLDSLEEAISSIEEENDFTDLKNYNGLVGVSGDDNAGRDLDKYFDSLLPKTAGGLWHELLAYIFMLRMDVGYILPLLLNQRLFSLDDHIVPPDFLIITKDKRVYGVEVGTKKEIQSGTFSLQTAIPTATLNTIDSRTSDRCPSCHNWIPLCDHVINEFSNLDKDIDDLPQGKIKCLEECEVYENDEIVNGECPYTKYRRQKRDTLDHSQHDYADNKHYHYRCVLNNVSDVMREEIIDAEDNTALVTHFPYYQGIEELIDS